MGFEVPAGIIEKVHKDKSIIRFFCVLNRVTLHDKTFNDLVIQQVEIVLHTDDRIEIPYRHVLRLD